MARSRVIKPEFWSDEKLSRLSRDARFAYIGLWTTCDDYGTTKGNPGWLNSQIFPYGDFTVPQFADLLQEIEGADRIVPFDHNGEKFYFLPTFQRHQRVDHPSKARNPEPPSSIIANQSRDFRDETETETENNESKTERETKHGSYSYSFEFEDVYKDYPVLEGKAEAYEIWKGLTSDEHKLIKAAISKQKQQRQQQDRREFVPEWPLLKNWLKGRRWEDATTIIQEQPQEPITEEIQGPPPKPFDYRDDNNPDVRILVEYFLQECEKELQLKPNISRADIVLTEQALEADSVAALKILIDFGISVFKERGHSANLSACWKPYYRHMYEESKKKKKSQ